MIFPRLLLQYAGLFSAVVVQGAHVGDDAWGSRSIDAVLQTAAVEANTTTAATTVAIVAATAPTTTAANTPPPTTTTTTIASAIGQVSVVIGHSTQRVKCVTVPLPVICSEDAGNVRKREGPEDKHIFQVFVKNGKERNEREVCVTSWDDDGWTINLVIGCELDGSAFRRALSSATKVCVQFGLLVACGWILRLSRRLCQENASVLSALILNLTLPAASFIGLQGVMLGPANLLIVAIGFVSSLFLLPFAWYATKHVEDVQQKNLLACHCLGYSVGQFGLPLFEGMYGKDGLETGLLFDLGNRIVVFLFVYAYLFVTSGTVVNEEEPEATSSESGPRGSRDTRLFRTMSSGPRRTMGSIGGTAQDVLGMTEVQEEGFWSAKHDSRRRVAWAVGKKVLMSVPLWGCVLGVVFSGLKVQLDKEYIVPSLTSLGRANSVLVCVTLGVFVSLQSEWARIKLVLWVIAVRFVGMLIMAIGTFYFLRALHYDFAVRDSAVQCLLLPPSMGMLAFAVEFNMDAELSTLMLSLSCIVSMGAIIIMEMVA